jgi:hypothetical protein
MVIRANVSRHGFVLLGDEFLAAAAQSRELLHTPTPHQYRISVPAAATTAVTTTTSIICTAPSFPFPYHAHAYSDVVQEQLLVGDQRAMAKKLEDPVFDEGPIFDEELVLDPNLAAATSLEINMEPSNFNSGASFNCSTKCPSRVVDIMASVAFDEETIVDDGPIFDEDLFDLYGLQGVSLEQLVECGEYLVSDALEPRAVLEIDDKHTHVEQSTFGDPLVQVVAACEQLAEGEHEMAADNELLDKGIGKEQSITIRSSGELFEANTQNIFQEVELHSHMVSYLTRLADDASGNVENIGKLQMPWDPGGSGSVVVSVQELLVRHYQAVTFGDSVTPGPYASVPQWSHGNFSLGKNVPQQRLSHRMTSRQWDPGILRYVASSTYTICSSFQFLQSLVTLLVPLLQVLYAAYLKTQWGLILRIYVTIWLKLREFVMSTELKLMGLCLLSPEEKCASVRSEWQQANLGDGDGFSHMPPWTQNGFILEALSTFLVQFALTMKLQLLDSFQGHHLLLIILRIIRHWDPRINSLMRLIMTACVHKFFREEGKLKMTRRRVCCANAWCCLGTSNILAGR